MEEGDLCTWCVENSRPMVVCHEVLAGHGGFQPQADRVIDILRRWPELAVARSPQATAEGR